MTKKVLIAMSGGVDSAVAALLVKNMGHEAGGITMKVWSDGQSTDDSDLTPDQNCTDAKLIADLLNIPHHIVSLGDRFKKCVVDRFLTSYANGLTPNPCVDCNKHIKFGALYDQMVLLGYNTLATGHYARIEENSNGNYVLKKAKDDNKDQSYFLWSIDKALLPHLLFPLGDYTKSEIRDIAEKNGFANAHRSDSQDVCFIENGQYAEFIIAQLSRAFASGDFVDAEGNTIGKHSGIINYTIGQRKGLGVAFGQPMFVGSKNAKTNTVMLCTDDQLYSNTLVAKSINILTEESFDTPVRLQAKIRYRHTPATATVTKIDADTLSVKFDLPQRAIAPGQSVVFYDGDVVVGGGIIQ